MRFYDARLQITPDTPNEKFREDFQALIDEKWYETTTLHTILKEQKVGSFCFEELEVKLNHALDKTTGQKIGDDYREVIFKRIDQFVPKGLYYKFDDNYWLCHNTDEYNRTSKNIMIRRCNNFIRFKDEKDGRIISYPCVIEYDVSSPSPQVDNDIKTPNNHVTIWVQGNKETRKIVRNMRVMFGDDPYKITGYNKYLQNGIVDDSTPLYYIDAYLEEVSPYDDIENGIAYYNSEDYSIKINQEDFSQVTGYITTLTATVTDNGKVVDRRVKWYSSNENVVIVDKNGLITLVGEENSSADIICQLGKNKDIQSKITITIVENPVNEKRLVIEPIFISVSQGDEIIFNSSVYIDNQMQDEIVNVSSSGVSSKYYELESLSNNNYRLKCLKATSDPLILTFSYSEGTEIKGIKLKSMF